VSFLILAAGGAASGILKQTGTSTVLTRIRERCARTSELPLLVRSGVFFFFICLGRKVFWCVFRPFSRGGNFGLHSTPLSYAS